MSMSEIKTVGDLRKVIANLDDSFKIEMRIRRKLTDEELKYMPYPYPYETEYTTLEFDDIGYSDKELCLGVEMSSEEDALKERIWTQTLYNQLMKAYKTAEKWENPLMNDAGGSMDCTYIKGKLIEVLDGLRHYPSVQKMLNNKE